MGFSNLQDIISEVCTNGKVSNTYWQFANSATVGTGGRWYDGSTFQTVPAQNFWGELVQNKSFTGGAANWTLGSNWAWSASGYVAHTAGIASSIQQTLPQLVAGRTYRTEYTISSYGGAGNFTLSLGGTAGTGRSANGTYIENLVCGATTVLDIASVAGASGRVDDVSIQEVLSFLPYSDTSQPMSAPWHGGSVTPDTKALLGGGVVNAGAATFTPSAWVLVDILGCYPRIDMNSALPQTLSTATTLTRYTSGVGVRAFLVSTVASGAGAHTIAYSYTNQAGASGRNPPFVINGIASNTIGCLATAFGGTAAGYYGPFLPLADGDYGMRSVDSITLSAGTGAGLTSLVLCKPLLSVPLVRAAQYTEQDLLIMKPTLPQIIDGAYLSWLYMPNGALVASAGARAWACTGWG